MKKITFFKTLLIAVTMLVGGGSLAWADATSLYERGTTNEWSANDLTDWSVSSTSEYLTYSINGGLYLENTSANANFKSSYSTTKAISPTAKSIVSMTAVAVMGAASGRTTSYDYITIGGVSLRQLPQGGDNNSSIAQVYVDGVAQGQAVSSTRGGTYTFTVEINQATGAVKYSVSGGATISETSTTTSTAISNVIFGHNRGGSESYNTNIKLTKINITEELQTVTDANYTINYKLGDAIVKTVAGTSAVGAEVTALTAIDGEGEYAGKHYLITADAAPSMTLVSNAASNVLNVPVRAPYTATLNLTCTIGGVAQDPVSEVFTETDDKVCAWNYFYPMYLESGGSYYIASDITKFGETGTFTNGEIIEKNVDFTLVNDVAVFVEAESLNTNTRKNTKYSGGSTGFVTANVGYSLGTLPAGTYELSVYLEDRGDRGIYLKSGSYNGTEILNMGTNRNSPAGVYSKYFTLTEETSLFLTGFPTNEGAGTNQCANIDYILVKSLPAYVTKTITSAGYATLYSKYPLDFEGSSVKAYTADIEDDGITFTEVTEIPAYTGVLVANENGGNFNITVKPTDATISNNDFKGVLEDTEVAGGIYVLMDGGKGVGFYQTTQTFTVGAGTAYLPGGKEGTSRAFFAINGDASGISSIALPTQQAGQIFNLNGQRVNAPKKGLYIMDGKKVLVK